MFVCASAVPPQDKRHRRNHRQIQSAILFFLSANFFINFNGLKFSNTLPRIFKDSRFANATRRNAKIWFNWKIISDEANRAVRNQRIRKRQKSGRARPSGRILSAGMKTENSMRGATSIQVTGTTAGTVARRVSIFPCAMATMAQSSSSSGIVPPCSHACSGVQISAAAMNSQTPATEFPPRERFVRACGG
jgi:hypothetical protein